MTDTDSAFNQLLDEVFDEMTRQTNQQRIKLAEAIGWTRGEVRIVRVMGRSIPHQRWIDPEGSDRAQLPDPFTDANDDYAVLEWLRANKKMLYSDRVYYRLGRPLDEYQIGEYARAALIALSSGDKDD